MEQTTGEVLAFVDADDEVQSGWASALAQAASEGAEALAACFVGLDRSVAADRPDSDRDLHRGEGFLPHVGGGGLALLRTRFDEVGGFDEELLAEEDADLCFRVQLAGAAIVYVPDATVKIGRRGSFRSALIREARHGYWSRILAWKYQGFVFQDARRRSDARRAWFELLKSGALAVTLSWGQAKENLRLGVRVLIGQLGRAQAEFDLRTRRRRFSAPLQVDEEQTVLCEPLMGRPAGLILGDRVREVAALARALQADPVVAAAPPGPIGQALERWESPAPGGRELAETAARAGWRIDGGLAAARLDVDSPTTWGEAYVALHGVNAWITGKQAFVIAASGELGRALAQRLPDIPIMMIEGGTDPPRDPTVVISPHAMRRSPQAVAARAAEILPLADQRAVSAALALSVRVPPFLIAWRWR